MRIPLHARILIGAVVGATLGVAAHFAFRGTPELAASVTYFADPIGKIFLRALLMLVIPLVFSALVLGVAGLGDLKSVGRVGVRTLIYTVVVSAIATLIGVVLVNTLRPGAGISPELRADMLASAQARGTAVPSGPAPSSGVEFLVRIVPDNPLRAAADGDMLAVMFFALLFGIGVVLTRTDAARKLEDALQGLYDVSMRLIHIVIWFAPLGVAALLYKTTALFGYEVLVQLAAYVGVVLLALALHQFVVYSLSVKLLGGMSPRVFFTGIQEAMITAFSTSSSAATLPTALKVAEENLKLPPRISRFVLTVGSTANQNGTALFEGVTVLFLAQLYGIELGLGQQIQVVAICILAGIGTAGVPSGSIPVIAVILGMVGIPIEGLALVLGVDRLLDMCRTVLNVTGDLAAAVVVSRSERDRS